MSSPGPDYINLNARGWKEVNLNILKILTTLYNSGWLLFPSLYSYKFYRL
jgi:hypothetical protein